MHARLAAGGGLATPTVSVALSPNGAAFFSVSPDGRGSVRSMGVVTGAPSLDLSTPEDIARSLLEALLNDRDYWDLVILTRVRRIPWNMVKRAFELIDAYATRPATAFPISTHVVAGLRMVMARATGEHVTEMASAFAEMQLGYDENYFDWAEKAPLLMRANNIGELSIF